jgi:peptide/nickel transport system permease protein
MPEALSRLRLPRRHWGIALAWAILVGVAGAALLAPLVAPHDPLEQNLAWRLRPGAWGDGGTWRNLLGTDQLGRDLLSRVIYGARLSLGVGLAAVALAATAGVGTGLVAGYYRGGLDRLLMRLADIQLGMPFLLLAITIIAVFGPSIRNLIVVLSLGGWVVYARVVRGQVLSLRERGFVEAARALGARDRRILLRHMLPNVLPSVLVLASFALAQNIILESALSFLGLGAGPRTPSWGAMLSDSRAYLATAWWLATVPGLAIMLTALSINTMGDWLRDTLDPQLRGGV